MADFQYQMMLAIDREKVYPRQASESRIGGKTTVSFDYSDGRHATNLHVVSSSGNEYLDQAALQAVADAELPPKPSELEKVKHFIVTINFMVH